MNSESAVARIVAMFESMRAEDVRRLDAFYTADAWFKDPFNEVSGLERIQRIYAHMFEALRDPRFTVTERIVQGDQCFLVWEFRFALGSLRGGSEQLVRGGSHLRLAADGRIASHRDYWDAAEEVYEKVPLLGGLLRWLKRRASV